MKLRLIHVAGGACYALPRLDPTVASVVVERPRDTGHLGAMPGPVFRTVLGARPIYARHAAFLSELGEEHVDLIDKPHAAKLEGCNEQFVVTFVPSQLVLARARRSRLAHETPDTLFAMRYGAAWAGYLPLRDLAHRAVLSESKALDDGGALERVLGEAHQSQRALDAYLERTPGRSRAHRADLFARLQRVRVLVSGGGLGDLQLSDLLDLAAMSPCHLVRTYQTVFGTTPHRELGRAKARTAAKMLLDHGLTMGDVAYAVGFDNRCSFSRWFRSEAGCSPSEFRARARRAAAPRPELAANDAALPPRARDGGRAQKPVPILQFSGAAGGDP